MTPETLSAMSDDDLRQLWRGLSKTQRDDLVRSLAPNPASERTESLRIRLSPTEKANLCRLAVEAGESVSAYVRRTCGL